MSLAVTQTRVHVAPARRLRFSEVVRNEQRRSLTWNVDESPARPVQGIRQGLDLGARPLARSTSSSQPRAEPHAALHLLHGAFHAFTVAARAEVVPRRPVARLAVRHLPRFYERNRQQAQSSDVISSYSSGAPYSEHETKRRGREIARQRGCSRVSRPRSSLKRDAFPLQVTGWRLTTFY